MDPSNEIKIVTIAACTRDGVMGRGGELPWQCPSDMRYFAQKTNGKILVMGRKTADSLKKSLKNRICIVLSSKPYTRPGFVWVSDLDSLWTICKDLGIKELWCIGGGEIYRQFLPWTDVLHLTIIDLIIENPDTWFPMELIDGWASVYSECGEDPLVNFYVLTPDPLKSRTGVVDQSKPIWS